MQTKYGSKMVWVTTFFVAHTHSAYSQDFSSDAIKNIGSGAAAIMQCEAEGFLPTGSTSNFLKTVRDNSSINSSRMIVDQYQISLHEKKIYSIAKKRWFVFRATHKECVDIGRIYPSLIHHFNSLRR